MEKIVEFEIIPRRYEFVKLRHRKGGDYFAYEILQVTHREGGKPELWAFATSRSEGKSILSFFDDEELDAFSANYVDEGWKLCAVSPNRVFRADGTSLWSQIAACDGGS